MVGGLGYETAVGSVILLDKLLLEDNNIYNQSDIGSIYMKQRHPFLRTMHLEDNIQ